MGSHAGTRAVAELDAVERGNDSLIIIGNIVDSKIVGRKIIARFPKIVLH
jgi:hypothetical protein